MSRRRRTTSLLLVVSCAVALSVAGCAEGELEEEELQDNQSNQIEDVGPNQGQDAGPNDQEEDAGPNQDANGGPKPTAEPTEAHQICAAGGETTDGDVESLHCFAPHDISGFEATDGERTWKPGAFRVVAE